ncbi:MAG: VWA domain-containing protein [Candidatus Aminicenantales bacterium]
MRKPILGLAAFFCILAGSYHGHGGTVPEIQQEQAQLQHEVKVTLKLVQIYVTDKKGNPVVDLSKDDFLVYDEGQKQTLTEFERHILRLPGEKEKVAAEVVDTPAPPARELMPRKFFFFLDFAFNNAKGIDKTKEAALHFIDTQLQPTDEVGLLSYSATRSLTLHEYLTTDHAAVRKIIKAFGIQEIVGRAEDFEARYWNLLKEQNPVDASLEGYVFDPERHQFKELEVVRRQREESKLQAYNFIRKMTDLAKALRYVPGHKSLLYFSSGVPYSVFAGVPAPETFPSRVRGVVPKDASSSESSTRISGMDYSDKPERVESAHLISQYEDMLKELSSANCTIYALDTIKLTTVLGSNPATRGTYTLQQMSSATGGKYFGNISSYEKHIEKIQGLTGSYYVLGYYVDDTWDGAYHKIKVEVTRSDLEVHAQKGYFNPKPFSEYSHVERMLHLVDLALSEEPLFQTPVRFPLEVVPCPAESKGNLCLSARIPVERIRGVLAGKSEFVAVIFDDKENIVTLSRNEKRTYTLTGELFTFGAAFSLSPGKYQCRLVIRNLETGRGAVASATAVILGE